MTIIPKEVSQSASGVWGLSLEPPKVTTLKRAFWSFSTYLLGPWVHHSAQGPKSVRAAVVGSPKELLGGEPGLTKAKLARHLAPRKEPSPCLPKPQAFLCLRQPQR